MADQKMAEARTCVPFDAGHACEIAGLPFSHAQQRRSTNTAMGCQALARLRPYPLESISVKKDASPGDLTDMS